MSDWRKATTYRITRMMLSKSAIGARKLTLPLLFVVAALVVVGAGSPALAWGGKPIPGTGKNGANPYTINMSCNQTAPHTFTSAPDAVYFNNSSNNLNVRNDANGSCIITTLAPGGDVVAVPGVALKIDNNNNKWIEVAYYQGNCQTCTNYDWQHVGWMAYWLLTPATQGFTCETGSGCTVYSVQPNGSSGAWSAYCPPPISGQPSGCSVPSNTYGIPESTSSQCTSLANDPNVNGGGQNSCSVSSYHTFVGVSSNEVYADDENPDWFYNGQYSQAPYFFVWNYDWWAH